MPGNRGPALSRGLAVVPDGNTLLVQGPGTRHTFRGRSATGLLPKLFALLDGSRTRPQLAAELGLAAAGLDRALALLAGRGLLDDVPHTDVAAHVLDFYGRNLGENGGHPSTRALLGVLAGAALHVVGPAPVAETIAADLGECGLTDSSSGPLDAARAAVLSGADRALAVVVEDGTDKESTARTEALCGPVGVPVLRAAVVGDGLELGPSFLPGFTACPACLDRGRAAAGRPRPSVPDDAAGTMLAGLVATEVLTRLTGSSTRSLTVLTTISPGSSETATHLVVPERDCHCDDIGGDGELPDAADVALWATERSSPAALRPGAPSRAVQRGWSALQEDRPTHHAHPHRALDRRSLPLPAHLTFGDGVVSGSRAGLDEACLADLLARVAGRRAGPGEPPGQRWVPSGGQLGSVELYLVAGSGVPGLPGTLFRYDDLAHALIALRADAVELKDALVGTDLATEKLDAAIVFSAAHGRLARKYQDFALRLAHLDAGCATTQLAAVAGARGLSTQFATRWDTSLAEVFDLVPGDQVVTAVAGLHRGETCR